MMKKVDIYTDGACSGNPGPGGFGAILVFKGLEKEVSGAHPQTTNNRNHWQDWALVLRRCHESRWHEAACPSDPIPKGASGVLGEAELEANPRARSAKLRVCEKL